ncbi:MAG: replication-relaxation family protein [Rhizobiaceae bacterium]|nr:replication-relaxation family protein [Rhizobiaceae bacterium]
MTARDVEILRWLYRYRYLSRDHLLAAFRPQSRKRFVERLGDLFHETGFIRRPVTIADRFEARATPMIYEITPKGVEYLEAIDALPHRAVTFSRRSRRAYNPQTLHTMAVIDAVLDKELKATAQAQQRFVPVDEILARAPQATQAARNPLSVPVMLHPSDEHPIVRSRIETHLIPDALYGVEYLIDGNKRYRFWALECERTSPASRSTTAASSTALKRAAYDALIQSGAFKRYWGIPNLKLHICRNAG